MENENNFAKYTYIPPTTCFTSSTSATEKSLMGTTSTDVKLSEKDDLIKNKLQLDKNIYDNGISIQNHENLKESTLKEASEISNKNNILDDILDDDFQDCHLQSKIIKRLADESFFCAVCKKDLKKSNLEERSTHVNQCIDYHSSVAASCEKSSSQTSSAFILDCPLCFKHFPSPELRSTHIKKCGKSRGLSIQSVIQAIHLQEKHVLERRALGLPLHRTNQTKQQKKNIPKKFSVHPKSVMQSDLQLAKALSLSLKEIGSQSQQNVIASSSNIGIVQVAELQVPSESQNPGKIPTKRKKPLNYTYPLLLRTQQEREKIILEKVNALIAPMCQSELDVILTESKPITENQKLPLLWNLSSRAEDKSSYYVQQLLDWIMPSDIEAGSKLFNLSQIPGHRICTQLPCDYSFSSDKTLTDGDVMPECSQLPSLVNSLQSLIGNSWMSDIDIHTASGIVIPAHKLILALRCSSLRNAFDEPVNGGKHILNWQDTSFDTALHFLNFLYTGTTEWKEDVFDELIQLAKKYEVKDLLYILNNSCETIELITDEDSAMDVCNKSNRDTALSNEEESNEVSVCFNHPKEKILSPSMDSVETSSLTNTKNTENVKVCDIHEQSFNLTKEINNKSSAICNIQEFGYLSSDCTNKVHILKQDRSDSEIIHNENIPGELYVVGSKFDDLITEKSNDLFSSTCIENPACKVNIESYNTESESSNDSCKIVKAEITIPYTPTKSIAHQSVIFPMACSTSRNWIAKNNTSPVLFSCDKNLNKICTPEKYECLCSEATVTERNLSDSNEDIVVLDECGEIKNKVQNVSPISFKGRLPLKRHYKLNRFSEEFSESPFHMYDENDDFNSAICLSQNAFLQGQINVTESCGLNLNVSQTSIISQKAMYSSPKQPLTKFDKIQVHKESNQLVEKVTDKTCYTDFSKQILTDAGNLSQQDNAPSPEIFICDSDNDVDSILGPNYFHQQNSFMEKRSSDCSSSIVIGKQNSFSKSFGLSPVKNDANLSRNPVIKNDRSLSPDIIYCDSSSNDNEDLTMRIQSLQKAKGAACRELSNTSPLHSSVHLQVENMRKRSDATSEDMLSTSPESPWIFRAGKERNDLQDSACSSQLNTRTASECIQKKIQNKISPLKDKNKNSFYPSTPNSSLAPKFKISDSPITPFPDYNNMQTPEIKEALKKIGVRALPRKKAVAVLSHVYDETHPWNESSSQCLERNLEPELQSSMKNTNNKKMLSLPKKRKQVTEISDRAMKKTHGTCTSSWKRESEEVFNKEAKTTKSCCSSQPIISSKAQIENLVHFPSQASEKNICTSPTGSCNSREDNEHDVSFSSELSDNCQTECKGNTESIKEYILSNEDLYQRVLRYTPLNLADLQQELKENGMNISIKKLMDYLDEQCITFTCPRKEEYKKKQQVRTQRFRKRMISKLSQQGSSNPS